MGEKFDQAEMTAVATKQLCVRGYYHVYKDVWAAVVGENLVCRREKEIPTTFNMLSNKR